MKYFTRGVAVAATAVALSANTAYGSEALLDEVLNAREVAADRIAEAINESEQNRVTSGPETMTVQVAEIQAMNESDLQLELRSMYSTSKEAQEKQMYPVGSLEAMQDVLNTMGNGDEEQRDVNMFMNRFAYLLGKVIDRYNDFFTVKVALGVPTISKEEYKQEAAKLPVLASKWTAASELLVGYLNLAANDLRDKWEQNATTDKRLRDTLTFIEKLGEVYEAQQRQFRMGYALAQLRYLEHPDRQADLTQLMEDPRQKQATIDFEDAIENAKEKTHQARKAAKGIVEDGFLASEYLTLLPFPHDKERERQDLPDADDL